jgi:hypothetical protein
LLWLIAFGSALFIYASLATSRRRKQRLVDRTWRNEAPNRVRARLALARIDIDDATASAIAGAFFDALYEGYGVRTFGQLMRAMTKSAGSDSERIARAACEKAAEFLPETSRLSGAALIRGAIEDAGSAAQSAGEQSGEI